MSLELGWCTRKDVANAAWFLPIISWNHKNLKWILSKWIDLADFSFPITDFPGFNRLLYPSMVFQDGYQLIFLPHIFFYRANFYTKLFAPKLLTICLLLLPLLASSTNFGGPAKPDSLANWGHCSTHTSMATPISAVSSGVRLTLRATSSRIPLPNLALTG